MEKATLDLSDLSVEDSGADRKLLIAVDFGTTYSGVGELSQICRVICFMLMCSSLGANSKGSSPE